MRNRGVRRGAFAAAPAALLSVVFLAGCGGADYDQDSLDPKGPAADKIFGLFTPFAYIATAIGILVIAATVYAAWRFRARPGHDDNPKQVHGNTTLEVAWTIAPALILVVMAVPTVATIFDLDEKPDDALEITVLGKQWWWEYEYTGEGFVTANELHIPVDRPVALTLRSDNVIHSFWVPNLAGKRDVEPGRDTHLTIEADEPGVYLGQCAEYCGLSHANMRLRVIAESQSDYEAWVAAMKQPVAGAAARFVTDSASPLQRYGCLNCHAFDGVETASARIGPNLTHVASRSTIAGATLDLTEENLRRWIRDAPALKPNEAGKGVGMPSFRESMTDEDLDALVAYLLERH